jgi:hypothetical protein
MPVYRNFCFKKHLAGAALGLAICLGAIPVAAVVTIALMPLWSWLEEAVAIEAVGHSGPAEWCYLLIYVIVITAASLTWSMLKRQSPTEDK